LRTRTIDEFRAALTKAKAADRTTVVYIEADPVVDAPSSEAWWDVPVAEVAALDTTKRARAEYEQHKREQRHYL